MVVFEKEFFVESGYWYNGLEFVERNPRVRIKAVVAPVLHGSFLNQVHLIVSNLRCRHKFDDALNGGGIFVEFHVDGFYDVGTEGEVVLMFIVVLGELLVGDDGGGR